MRESEFLDDLYSEEMRLFIGMAYCIVTRFARPMGHLVVKTPRRSTHVPIVSV